MDSERAAFLYKHTLFISRAASSEGVENRCSLHYWHHRLRRATYVTPTNLTLDSLHYILTFHGIGTFPVPSSQPWAQDEQALPTSLAVLANLTSENENDIDEPIIEEFIAQFQPVVEASPLASPNEIATIQLYSIEVLTREEDAFDQSNVGGMVWKWAKPVSPYRKSGHWCSTIEEAVTDGIWNAGSGLSVLMKVVGEAKKNSMFEDGKMPQMIPVIE